MHKTPMINQTTGASEVKGTLPAVRDTELAKRFLDALLSNQEPAKKMEELRKEGIIEKLLPEFTPSWGPLGEQDQNWHPEGNVWTHTLKVLDMFSESKDPVLRLTAMFHDITKPECQQVWPDGGISNHGHANSGSDLFEQNIASRLGLSKEVASQTSWLIRHHRQAGTIMEKGHELSEKRLRYLQLNPLKEKLAEFAVADRKGSTLEGTIADEDVQTLRHKLQIRKNSNEAEVITEKEWELPESILITQCAQPDFMRLLKVNENLPNLVHIGRLAAKSLLGENGSLLEFLQEVHKCPPEKVAEIHIVDEHDEKRDAAHWEQFGKHTEIHSEGAKLIGDCEEMVKTRPNTFRIAASDLNDFVEPETVELLRKLTQGRDLKDIKIAVIGVWTDVKVQYLLYMLKTVFGAENLATCSNLTASKSLENHYNALEHFQDALGVKVFHSHGDLLEWMNPESSIPMPEKTNKRISFKKEAELPRGWTPEQEKERDLLIESITDASEELTLSPLGGGFSGCQVLLARTEERISVMKIGPRYEIAGERYGNERVGRALDGSMPKMIAYKEGPTLAIMEQELACAEGEDLAGPFTLQELMQDNWSEGMDENLVSAIRKMLDDSLGRFYRTAEKDNANLLASYGFTDNLGRPQFASHVIASAHKIAEENGFSSPEALLEASNLEAGWIAPKEFYTEILPDKAMMREVYSSLSHADPNLMNVLQTFVKENLAVKDLWTIDFAKVNRLPVLTDFAKIENDLSYIVLPADNQEVFERSLKIQKACLMGDSLKIDPDKIKESLGGELSKEETRYLKLVKELREIAAEMDPRGAKALEVYRMAQLRYAAHTLSFDEPNHLQRKLALTGCARLSGVIASGLRLY